MRISRPIGRSIKSFSRPTSPIFYPQYRYKDFYRCFSLIPEPRTMNSSHCLKTEATPKIFKWTNCRVGSLLSLAFGLGLVLTKDEASELSESKYPTFVQWKDACNKLIPNRRLDSGAMPSSPLDWNEMNMTLDKFYSTMSGKIPERSNEYDKSEISMTLKKYAENLSKLDTGSVADPSKWIADAPLIQSDSFWNLGAAPFKPFVQKLELPRGSRVVFHGDAHGDIHSLLAYISELQSKGYMNGADAFKIKDKNFYMIFLGDYADRGKYGSEVMYTIMRLRIANPDRVFMVRGNHEDVDMTARYGFKNEFMHKFDVDNYKKSKMDGEDKKIKMDGEDKKAKNTKGEGVSYSEAGLARYQKMTRIYDFLPVAIYLGHGDTFWQCCHGGMELGFNPQKLLSHPGPVGFEWFKEIRRKDEFDKLPESIRSRINDPSYVRNLVFDKDYGQVGFMWNDFYVRGTTERSSLVPLTPVEEKSIENNSRADEQSNDQFFFGKARGGPTRTYGRDITRALLKQASGASDDCKKVCGVFRAHQHDTNPSDSMMKSILDEGSPHRGVSKLWQDVEEHKDAHYDAKNRDSKKASNSDIINLWPGIVCTFCVAPDSDYGKKCKFNFDTYGIFTVGDTWRNCSLDVCRIDLDNLFKV